MADLGIKLELLGDKDIDRMLRGWSPVVQRRITRPGITKVSRMVAKQAKKSAPKKSGVLKASIGQVVRTYKSGVVVGIVGPRKGYARAVHRSTGVVVTRKNVEQFHGSRGRIVKQDPVKYAHLVESGTAPHSLGKGSRIVKSVMVGAVVDVRKSGRRYRRKLYEKSAGEQTGRRHPGTKGTHFLRSSFFRVVPHARAVMKQSVGENVAKQARRLVRRAGFAA